MDNNIPDTGHIPRSKYFAKKDQDRSVQKEENAREPLADQLSLSSEAKAKAEEAKKIEEWVDILKEMPDDEERLERGRKALQRLKENPNEMIRLTAQNMMEEWSTD